MHGAWLSLVERVVRDYEVAGSNPVAPMRKGHQQKCRCPCFCNAKKRQRRCPFSCIMISLFGTSIKSYFKYSRKNLSILSNGMMSI